jgi:hypothetical protein
MTVMKSPIQKKYREKAIDSFNTRLTMYLFLKAITRDWPNVSELDFRSFEIDEKLIEIYTTKYWQYEANYELVPGLSNDDIYKEISFQEKKLKFNIDLFRNDYLENIFPVKYPFEDFEKLLEAQECAYCNISINEIFGLGESQKLHKKNYRGWTLEIDRKDSNLEYTPDNCVMACYWCNNAKTDEFTFDEFKKIGQAIHEVWVDRLSSPETSS